MTPSHPPQTEALMLQAFSGNPDLLAVLMNLSLVLRLPREVHLSRSSSSAPAIAFKTAAKPQALPASDKMRNSMRPGFTLFPLRCAPQKCALFRLELPNALRT